ncbi:HNH endonuclease [Lysobacter enzymogenes]|uniref:HNH endonuclease n=1 Tax=Lysobacter enzymogenes TaxID=69 RepID=UPI001AF0B8A5|nr:hypothetical protein [Lysobacter enzymogenes]QQQ00262.1 hypothetical protein JHW41_19505 [Lysobacter enzymogenes]
MKIDLGAQEREFFAKNLPSLEARAFFRSWRRSAGLLDGAWSTIRDGKFKVNGTEHNGASLITKLRNHLVSLQDGYCCYCRRSLQGIAWAKPIDHVLPKDKFPRFTFHYRNLAVACYDCNHVKRNSEWSSWNNSQRKYIPARRCRRFFHPRYHIYDDHVRYLHISTNGASLSVYFGTTEQGKKLCADLLHKSAARRLAISANPRLDAALTKIRNQIDEMELHADAEHLENFLEALEKFALPGI